MQISEAWLRDLVNPPIDTQALAAQLTMAGLEVDALSPVAAAFEGVVVAEIISIEQHPNADKLRVCQVNAGLAEPLQIVCGAANARAGLKAPAALIGAVLPGDFKIKASKLRGVESFGMMCSETELGLAEAASGLMELAADAPVGENIRAYLHLDDHVIELGLTPNRADCLSAEGVAREIAALNCLPFAPVMPSPIMEAHAQTLAVELQDPAACPVYLGRLITGINAEAETPLWMAERLRRSGVRSLSPVVDVTNYVLLELGQPLHAFDADKLSAPIVVRRAQLGESLELLNGQELTLDTDALVIADQQRALALAGVMGGEYSAVSGATQNIFLECAFFNPVSIAGKARKYGLHTDSSHRFERGVDFGLQLRAMTRATELILAISGGQAGPITEARRDEYLPARQAIRIRRRQVEKMLGVDAAAYDVTSILQRLGMLVEADADGWLATPPSFRFDVAIEADLIEEIARVIGYNQLPSSYLCLRNELTKTPEAVLPLARLQDCLVDRAYQEAITYSFVDAGMQQLVDPETSAIAIQNPISAELAIMRGSLWCGLLTAALYNVNRQQGRVRLFETGMRFFNTPDGIQQQKMLAGLALGPVYAEQWGEASRNVDFFDVKADVEALLGLGRRQAEFRAAGHPALHPGQSAEIVDGERWLGRLGMLHPVLEKQLGFNGPVFLFELEQSALLERITPRFSPLSKFPSVRRDMALLVDEKLPVGAVTASIRNCGLTVIRDVQLFDTYQGPGVANGYKSVALSLHLQDDAQTLTDNEIEAVFSQVLAVLAQEHNAKLRD